MRIPRRVVSIEHPAPVAESAQRHPDGHSERAGQVPHCRVHRDHEIERADGGRGVREVVRAERHEPRVWWRVVAGLQRDYRDPGEVEQRRERGEGHGPMLIARMRAVARPGEAHPHAVKCPNARRDRPIRRGQVRHRCGELLDCGRAHAQRQPHEPRMHIGARHRVAGRKHFDAGKGRKQRHQGRRARREHPACAALAQHREVARQLELIAQPLLGVHENRATIERRAVPLGRADRRDARYPRPMLQAREARGQIALHQREEAEVHVGIDVILPAVERAQVRPFGTAEVTRLGQHRTQHVPRLGLLGMAQRQPLGGPTRRGRRARQREHPGTLGVRRRMIRGMRQCARNRRFRVVVPSRQALHHGQLRQDVRIGRRRDAGREGRAARTAQVAARGEYGRAADVRCRVGTANPQRAIEGVECLGGATGAFEHATEVAPPAGAQRRDREGVLHERNRIFGSSRRREEQREVAERLAVPRVELGGGRIAGERCPLFAPRGEERAKVVVGHGVPRLFDKEAPIGVFGLLAATAQMKGDRPLQRCDSGRCPPRRPLRPVRAGGGARDEISQGRPRPGAPSRSTVRPR